MVRWQGMVLAGGADQQRTTPLCVADDVGIPLTLAVARAVFNAAEYLCFLSWEAQCAE